VHRGLFTATVLAVLALGEPAVAASVPAPLTVKLAVSNANPRQNHGAVFTATPSSGGVAIYGYLFRYGDGVEESTYQPQATHAYPIPGTYEATVAVIDVKGRAATSAPVRVMVRDGVPPVVRITSPRAGQHIHLGQSGFVIRGTAVDPGPVASGVRRVELALEFLSATARGCPWFDGQHALVVRGCGSPLFFRAKVQNGGFSFRLDPHLAWLRGEYAVRVRAVDWAGNVSDFYAIKLRTILGFFLAP
jgi:hypothetical protein